MSDAEYALVTAVDVDSDKNRVTVNAVAGPEREARQAAFETPARGLWMVPEPGDVVELYEVSGAARARFPTDGDNPSLPSGLGAGDIVLSLGTETELAFKKQSDGTYTVSLAADNGVTVSGSSVTIDSSTISIGGNGNTVAKWDHTHDVDLSDGTTATTTTPPSSTETNTTIE